MSAVVFDDQSAKRISEVVRRVEGFASGNPYRRNRDYYGAGKSDFPFRVIKCGTTLRVTQGNWTRYGLAPLLLAPDIPPPYITYKTITGPSTGGTWANNTIYFICVALEQAALTKNPALVPSAINVYAYPIMPVDSVQRGGNRYKLLAYIITDSSGEFTEVVQSWFGGDIDDIALVPDGDDTGVVALDVNPRGRTIGFAPTGALTHESELEDYHFTLDVILGNEGVYAANDQVLPFWSISGTEEIKKYARLDAVNANGTTKGGKSLEIIAGSSGKPDYAQINDFQAASVAESLSSWEDLDGDSRLIMIRKVIAGVPTVTYSSLASDFKVPYAAHADTADAFAVQGKYWECGGGTVTCYGSAISSAVGGPVLINLTKCILGNGTTYSVDWAGRFLYSASGCKSVDWGDYFELIDISGYPTVGWNSRILYKLNSGSPVASLDWSYQQLFSNLNTVTVDWNACLLKGYIATTSFPSIDWNSRIMYKEDGATAAFNYNSTGWGLTLATNDSWSALGLSVGNDTEATSSTGALICLGGGSFVKKVFASAFGVGANQVVGAQGAAVADATGAGDVVAQLNSLLARLRTHGLIAT